MSQSTYSFCGTPLHLILDDDLADAYNRAQDKFSEAQKKFKAEYGIPWNPITHAIDLGWTEEETKAWDSIGRVINLLVEINGGSIDVGEEDMTADNLVKL